MNRLAIAKRAQIARMLAEGNSLRTITRMTGVSINAVTELLVDLGCACVAMVRTARAWSTPRRVTIRRRKNGRNGIYAEYGEMKGLRRRSRQDDRGHAVMLFGARVKSADLVVAGAPMPLLAGDLASAAVIHLAIRIRTDAGRLTRSRYIDQAEPDQ